MEGRPDPKIFLWIAVFVADAAVVNPNGIKTLLSNGFNTFFIKAKPVFCNGPRSLSKNPPDSPIFNFILADEPFEKLYEALKLVYYYSHH